MARLALSLSPARFAARALLALGATFIAALALAHQTPADAPETRNDVVFTRYTPLSSNAEMARRLLSPLTAARIPAALARSGKVLAEQPIDLARERFMVIVPARAPPGGYGLLVFVPPWESAAAPQGWAPVLDRAGVIFVSAARSGNVASPLSRREPLALLAWANITRRYKVDPARVYIAGFSGGSRVAMRLALGYPDVFVGALLDAGADRIGDRQVPLPPRDLFAKFQESTRLVFLAGARDGEVLDKQEASMASMREWCVQNLEERVMPLAGHEAADSAALSRALEALASPARPDPAKLAACRVGVERRLAAAFQAVGSLIAGGKRDEARRRLDDIDGRFGGLAAPRSLDLARRVDMLPD